jgi:hypothetical protein
MKRAIQLTAIGLLVASIGCGSSTGLTQQVSQTINVAGIWQIATRSSVSGVTGSASGSLSQTATSISGQIALAGTPCATSAALTGTVSGTTLSVSINENGQVVTLSGTVAGDGNSASGTYSAPAGGCTNGDSGTWSGNRLPQLSSITLNPASVIGGSGSTATVTLSGAAVGGGAIVTLSSNNTLAATVPASVTVPAGATTATFTVSTHVVSTITAVTISGTYNGSQGASLVVNPPVLAPTISVFGAAGSINVLGTVQFTATIQNLSNTLVSWQVDGVANGNSTYPEFRN